MILYYIQKMIEEMNIIQIFEDINNHSHIDK